MCVSGCLLLSCALIQLNCISFSQLGRCALSFLFSTLPRQSFYKRMMIYLSLHNYKSIAIYNLSLNLLQNTIIFQFCTQMIVKSTFFKKQFDVSKAELIGQGNFAQVYRVFDTETQSYMAIRRVDRDLGEKEDIQKQKTINQELKRVENQNILKIFQIIQSETCIWYITQYCEGGSLWDALNNCVDNKMNEKDALECIYQVSKGVKQLHNHRITHRDLKPENILLKNKYLANKFIPTIKIADFGLSTKKIIMETIAGTKEYIAPQQARFHNYTNAVDVWSLGIIFDEILHGSPFYVGDNNKQVFQKILKNPYKVRDESIRPSIQQFLMSVLKKKAYERPIIAVICQNIEKILQQIKKQKQDTNQKIEPIFQKKGIKFISTVPMNQQQIKPESKQQKNSYAISNLQHSLGKETQFLSPKQNLTVMSSREIYDADYPKTTIPTTPTLSNYGYNEDKSSTKKQQRKAKTPFKRQNGRRPQFVKSTQEIEAESQPAKQRVILTNKRQVDGRNVRQLNKQLSKETAMREIGKQVSNQTREVSKQKQLVIEPITRNESGGQIEKINIYRVDKKKIQTLPMKHKEPTPNIIDIKEYMEGIIKTKNDLLQTNISVVKERQFILNSQLTINDFPSKFEGEEMLRKFGKDYDFLNYITFNPDYEVKLYRGKNQLTDNKIKVENEMKEYKEKIKKSFLSQIDKYIDYYVQKTLK